MRPVKNKLHEFQQTRRCYQGARSDLGLLDHQNPCNNAWRDWRRCGFDVDESRIPRRHGYFCGLVLGGGSRPGACKEVYPSLYWATIIATTTVGTTLADFATRSLGIGYTGGSLILLALLMASLFVWHRTLGSVAVNTVASPKSELFYWVTIMFSQTPGTALGDWTADTADFGYSGAAMVFGALPWGQSSHSNMLEFCWKIFHSRPTG